MHGYYRKCLNISWVSFSPTCAKRDPDLTSAIMTILFRMSFGSLSFKYKSLLTICTMSQILSAYKIPGTSGCTTWTIL